MIFYGLSSFCCASCAGKARQRRPAVAVAMKRNLRPRASDAGFTLLELIISMTLLVLIIVLMLAALGLGSRSVAAGEKKIEDQERFRSVISIIGAQVESHAPLTYQEEGRSKYYFRGDRKTLRFATNYSIWGGQRGYVIADYKIETGNPGREIFTASESVPGLEGHRDIRFLDASSIAFEYFLKDQADPQGKWVEAVADGDTIPDRIMIHLTQGAKKLSLVFPVRVGGKIVAVQGGAPSVAAGAQPALPRPMQR